MVRVVLALGISAALLTESDHSIGAKADESSIAVAGQEASSGTPGVVDRASAERSEFRRIAQRFCGTLDTVAVTAPCVDGAASGVVARTCEDGSAALDPLFRRPVDPATGEGAGPWEATSDVGGCPEDPAAPVTLTAEEFRRLPLAASVPALQPADGHTLVAVPLILLTDPAPQELTTTVLGVSVRVRATPTGFTWDPGDGSAPVTTTEPGARYPHQTVTHTYTRPGTYALTLSTTWTGQFQVPGGDWLPVTGTATTTSAPLTITAHQVRSTLVADPLP